jgi:hypothetical protein
MGTITQNGEERPDSGRELLRSDRCDRAARGSSPAAPAGRGAADRAAAIAGLSQFISFAIGDDQYGVDIMAVREIKGWSEITHLPSSRTMCAACSICAASSCRSSICAAGSAKA